MPVIRQISVECEKYGWFRLSNISIVDVLIPLEIFKLMKGGGYKWADRILNTVFKLPEKSDHKIERSNRLKIIAVFWLMGLFEKKMWKSV